MSRVYFSYINALGLTLSIAWYSSNSTTHDTFPGEFLDIALTRLGLNTQERCDMITYWLAQLEAYPFTAIYFVDVQRYAQAAKLSIVPAPDVIIRVFMAFRWVSSRENSIVVHQDIRVSRTYVAEYLGLLHQKWFGTTCTIC